MNPVPSGHDLLLLMLSLSQLESRERMMSLFVESLDGLFPPARFGFKSEIGSDEANQGVRFAVRTLKRCYGFVEILSGAEMLSDEQRSLLWNALQMLAIVVERNEQERLLSDDRERLSREISQRNQDLERINRELIDGNLRLLEEIERHQRTMKALSESESRYRTLAEHMGDVVWTLDLSSQTFTYVSPSVFKLRGLLPEEIVGQHMDTSLTPESLKIARDVMAKRVAALAPAEIWRTSFVTELEQPCKDGTTVWTEVSTVYLPGPDGQPATVVGVSRDISDRRRVEVDRRRLETQIQQTQKLESLGVLAGGIAHDFNNLLTAVLGNLDMAKMEIEEHSEAASLLDAAEQASRRAADLCRQMLAYSGKGRFLIERIDLNQVIREMQQMLDVSVSKKARLELLTATDLKPIEADVTQIRQILMNLIINASEAIAENEGVITVRTENRFCSKTEWESISLHQVPPEGWYVVLEVRDTGCGMDAATVDKVFDPFFTTKFTGRGLGLAAVLGIIRGHGGTIRVESRIGRGTTFTVFLPAAKGTSEQVENGRKAVFSPFRGAGNILLVDDDEAIREIGEKMLQKLGFTVTLAANGEEALDVLKQRMNRGVPLDQRFRLVILDLTMPRRDGYETFLELRKLGNPPPVLLSSGFNEKEATERFGAEGLAGFLEKPYHLELLQEKVRHALGE